MEAFALYLFKSIVWLTGFALVYLLFLRNERYFLLNRIYLVAGILASIVFPFFTWHYTIVIPMMPSVEVPDLQLTSPSQFNSMGYAPQPFPTKEALLYSYLAGALYLLYRIIRQTVTVIGVIRKAEILPYRSAKLIRTDRYPSSFSFFSFVFVNPSSPDMETYEIVNHEMEHVRQKHWIDLVLFELLCTLQWLNPLCWLYGRFIRQNHEYLADQRALQRTQNPAFYRAALINQLFGAEVISLANSFNYSINKKRFQMMKNTIHPPYRKLKLLVVLPLIAGVFYAFATPEYRYAEVADHSIVTIQEATPVTDNILTEVQDTVKSSVFTLEGNFVAPSPMDESSPVSGFRFSAKKIQGQYGKGTEIVKGEDISLDLGNTTSAIFIDGKESTKAEFDKLDPKTIASVSTIKGESATTNFGEKGKNGVILITLKNGNTTSTNKVQIYTGMQFRCTDGSIITEPLIVIDGKISNTQTFMNLPKETISVINPLNTETAISKYGDKGKNGVVEVSTTTKQSSSENTGHYTTIDGKYYTKVGETTSVLKDSKAYTMVEEMPEFPGGEEVLKAYVTANIKYPAIALENSIHGIVYVTFVVDKTGSISSAKIIRGVDPELDKEALRIVTTMPKWKPGKKNGENVAAEYELPIDFKLPADYAIKRNQLFIYYQTGIKPEDQAPETKKIIYNGIAGKGKGNYTLENSDYTGEIEVKIIGKDGKLVRKDIKNGPTFTLDRIGVDGIYLYTKVGSTQYLGNVCFVSSTVYTKSKPNKKAEVKPAVNQATQAQELIIVPNPTSDKATITLKGSDYDSKLQVSVFDKDGKLIIKDSKTGPTFNLSFASFTSGNYFIVVKAGKDQHSGHLVVNH